jgi:hypothetical protein
MFIKVKLEAPQAYFKSQGIKVGQILLNACL